MNKVTIDDLSLTELEILKILYNEDIKFHKRFNKIRRLSRAPIPNQKNIKKSAKGKELTIPENKKQKKTEKIYIEMRKKDIYPFVYVQCVEDKMRVNSALIHTALLNLHKLNLIGIHGREDAVNNPFEGLITLTISPIAYDIVKSYINNRDLEFKTITAKYRIDIITLVIAVIAVIISIIK